MNNTIGIDVSKDTLDVHRLADGQHKQFLNSKTGHTHLIKWIELQPDPLVIFEATGAYYRLLERELGKRPIPFVKMGAALQLVPKPLTAESLYDLRDLLCARRALIKDRTAAKARNATVTHALLKGQFAKCLRHIECDIERIDTAMLALANQGRQMRERLDILSSSPGIGMTTALMILVDMPGIGGLDGKQVASLTGLAPMSQSSGKWQGKARSQGGRPNLRHAIFMPALVAIGHNADMEAKYDQLIAVGKEKNVAITAVMRKLLVLANALLRDQRKWKESMA